MGIVLGALGGMGEEMSKIGAANNKALMDEEADTRKATLSSGLALEREKALIMFKQTLGAQERADQVGRIDSAAGKIADEAVSAKRGIVAAGIADKEAWTPEQQAAVDQSLTLDRNSIAADPETRIKAGIATGDISPEKAATIERDDRRLTATERATAAKERLAEMRDATQRYIAELRHEDSQKRLDALIAKTGKDTDGVKEALSVIDGARKDLANEATNLKSLYATELKDKSRSEQARIAAEYKAKFDSIDEQRRQLDADYDSLRSKVGLPPRQPLRATPKDPPPAAQQPAGKPSAARPPLSSFLK